MSAKDPEVPLKDAAATLKDQGNAEFAKENWLKASALYTKAIKLDPTNAALYSNRSASLLKLVKVTKALEDAEECIKLRPEWEKGYYRKAAVLEEQGQLDEAIEVYQAALKLTPDSKDLAAKIRTMKKLAESRKSAMAAAAERMASVKGR